MRTDGAADTTVSTIPIGAETADQRAAGGLLARHQWRKESFGRPSRAASFAAQTRLI